MKPHNINNIKNNSLSLKNSHPQRVKNGKIEKLPKKSKKFLNSPLINQSNFIIN